MYTFHNYLIIITLKYSSINIIILHPFKIFTSTFKLSTKNYLIFFIFYFMNIYFSFSAIYKIIIKKYFLFFIK